MYSSLNCGHTDVKLNTELTPVMYKVRSPVHTLCTVGHSTDTCDGHSSLNCSYSAILLDTQLTPVASTVRSKMATLMYNETLN